MEGKEKKDEEEDDEDEEKTEVKKDPNKKGIGFLKN
jgi:hypothetical protein